MFWIKGDLERERRRRGMKNRVVGEASFGFRDDKL